MAKNLVIVESPSKIKTIKKFLGANYEVVASNGHIRDLPKSRMGIDVEDDYEPKYITIRGKGDKLAELRKEVKKADKVYLATDPDREGEAISWHLATALKLDEKKMKRITFNEITKNAVKASLKEPREIDMGLVDAQQARRALDRMVGYRISPVLWAKVKRGLSAGRVQSVALSMVCKREKEIEAFVPEEYWTIDAKFRAPGDKKAFTAKYYGVEGKKTIVHSREEVDAILTAVENAAYIVSETKKSERFRQAPLPFITSTLQQEASKVLNFSTSKTMRLAQQLYEGVDVKGRGTVGLITYLRTDSTRVSEEADAAVKEYIRSAYGDNFVGQARQEKNTGKKMQDAHEAIRPTDVTLTPSELKDDLTRDLLRLYQLIWKRFVASRMAAEKTEHVSVKITANEHVFTATAGETVFEGFKTVYMEADEEKVEKNGQIRRLEQGASLTKETFEEKQHFTQPPAHFTEATLVKALEEQGIGRPSTFAPTISTILGRRYIIKENKNLYVTELGEAVNEIMEEAFPVIVDTNFTANMESLLDMVEEGAVEWKTIIRNFYPDLESAVRQAEEQCKKVDIADEVSDVPCENCGRMMVIKYGPHGKFLACPGFPDCRFTLPYLEKIGVLCPKCGKDIVVRKTKKGRRYYGCEANPECDYMSWQKPAADANNVAIVKEGMPKEEN